MDPLDGVITRAEKAITEGRNTIQDLRAEPIAEDDLEHLLAATGQELAGSQDANGNSPTFRVTVEGALQTLFPILQDEVFTGLPARCYAMLSDTHTHATSRSKFATTTVYSACASAMMEKA